MKVPYRFVNSASTDPRTPPARTVPSRTELPPVTTATNASTRNDEPMPGTMAMVGAYSAPVRPASAEPIANVAVYMRSVSTPIARAVSAS
jgi:hypothetical protein